jgi:UDP-N-acetylmuramate-alanine ligase
LADLPERVSVAVQDGDVVLTMGAGSIDIVAEKISCMNPLATERR